MSGCELRMLGSYHGAMAGYWLKGSVLKMVAAGDDASKCRNAPPPPVNS
jgi:hypothetical protein